MFYFNTYSQNIINTKYLQDEIIFFLDRKNCLFKFWLNMPFVYIDVGSTLQKKN